LSGGYLAFGLGWRADRWEKHGRTQRRWRSRWREDLPNGDRAIRSKMFTTEVDAEAQLCEVADDMARGS
jgi:hypothetical protein